MNPYTPPTEKPVADQQRNGRCKTKYVIVVSSILFVLLLGVGLPDSLSPNGRGEQQATGY